MPWNLLFPSKLPVTLRLAALFQPVRSQDGAGINSVLFAAANLTEM